MPSPEHDREIDKILVETARVLEGDCVLDEVLEAAAVRLSMHGFRGAGLAVRMRLLKEKPFG